MDNYLTINEDVKIKIEIADDREEQMRGLMFRNELDENSGMLFVFEEEGIRPFWMKNTLMPLEIIHIDKDRKIVDIIHAVPCGKEPCERYYPGAKSKYALEVNEGFSEKNNVKIGSRVEF